MLTFRENQILELIARKGLTNAEVASELGIVEKTVKSNLHNMFIKLNVSNRVKMVLKFHNILEE